MTTVSEIAPDMFRISTFVPDFNLQFNQFLVVTTSHCCFILARAQCLLRFETLWQRCLIRQR